MVAPASCNANGKFLCWFGYELVCVGVSQKAKQCVRRAVLADRAVDFGGGAGRMGNGRDVRLDAAAPPPE